MDNKRKLSELIEAADNDTLKAVADAHPMVSDKKKDELYARISERVSIGDDYADSVSGVEVKHGRGASRFVGFAAALALVLAGLGGGGLLLKNRMGAAPAAELEESAEVVEETTEEETEEAVEEVTEAPTEADSEDYEAIARKLTDEYYEYIDKINGKALEIDRSVTIEKEEADESGIRYHNTYFLITDEELPNVEAARKRCFEIFDEEDGLAALKALAITSDEDWDYYSGNGFIDEGDCWYILEQLYDNTGVHTWTDDDDFSAELTPDGDIHVVRKTEYVCAKARYEERREFTLRKTDEGWRISDLYPVEQKIVNE